MSKFWKLNIYITLLLIVIYIFTIIWVFYIKEGNSSIVSLLLILPIVCVIHVVFSIISLFVRIGYNKNNKYALTSLFLSLVILIVQLVFLFIGFGMTSVSDW